MVLFSVLSFNVLKSDFQNFNWVVEFLVCAVRFAFLAVNIIFFNGVGVVSILKTFLKLFDLQLELLLATFTLCLQRQNIIIVIRSSICKADALFVHCLSSVPQLFNLVLHVANRVLCKLDFLAHNVDVHF